jgi:hypothetical protein
MQNMKTAFQLPAERFADWPKWLAADGSIASAQRAGHRAVIGEFLGFCHRRGAAPSIALAREQVELVRQEQRPTAGQLRARKEALNWFFRQVRDHETPRISGVPPLARADLGREPWERALVASLRERHLAWRTEQTYRGWMGRFVEWLGNRPPAEAGAGEVTEFLSHLAVRERIGVAAQRQALNALVFHFRHAEGRELGDLRAFVRARKRLRVPVVLT